MAEQQIRFRPIVTWPGRMTPADQRRPARYDASPNKTRDELLRELELLGATDVFIQGAYSDDQIRLDGMPRAGAAPSHPGIILTYTTARGTFQLPCDTFQSPEQNLRAIVLTLQRLRLIEETGVKTHGRQYEGFKALPPATADAPMSPATAAASLTILAGVGEDEAAVAMQILRSREYFNVMYRRAAMRTHPDRGGRQDLFERLQRAAEAIEKHHNERNPRG